MVRFVWDTMTSVDRAGSLTTPPHRFREDFGRVVDAIMGAADGEGHHRLHAHS